MRDWPRQTGRLTCNVSRGRWPRRRESSNLSGVAHDDSRRSAAVVIRERSAADLDACTRIVADVRRSDGYTPYLPGNDFVRLLTEPPPIVAFVATSADEIVGHVALHESTGADALGLACEKLAVDPAQLGVVARMFAAVGRRREGVGRLLLDAGAAAARSRGLVPILDVWVELRPAIAMYE